MIARTNITGLILCGGAGTRIDGHDKPLENLEGAPLVEHVRQRLLPQVARILISCNRNAPVYARWGDTVVADHMPGCGPLAGIAAGLARIESDYLFACPGDAPLLSTTLIERLADALDCDGADIALPHDGIRRQPLFLLMRRSLATALSRYLGAGGRAVHTFIDQQRHVVIDAAFEAGSFVNINTQTELDAATSAYQRKHGQRHRCAT
jgi:molybdopterin-guanine dinucleotide biosynthesis protein A